MNVTVWADELERLLVRIGPRFARSEARERAKAYLQGLLSPAERKNCWQLAEMMGEATPYAMQQFLYRGIWDADVLRDDLRRYAVEQLGSDEAVLVVDETGFIKKGTHSAGVQRQYSGTAGRIENCQIGVFLAYATAQGTALIDRALYLPQSWTEDRIRCRQAGIPDSIAFATKPEMALSMLKRAVAEGAPFGWVTGDSIYGDYRSIRLWLETLPKRYVMAVSAKEYLSIGWEQIRVSSLVQQLPADGWTRLSAGNGAKGPRLYAWQLLPVNDPLVDGWRRWLLARRSLEEPTDLATFVCCAPAETSLTTLAQVAGSRWRIECAFEEAKGEVGLDEYEIRSYAGWYRHITLACMAHALLTVMRLHTTDSGAETHATDAHAIEAHSSMEKGGPAQGSLTAFTAFKLQRGLSSP